MKKIEINGMMYPKYWIYKIDNCYNVWELLEELNEYGNKMIRLLGTTTWFESTYRKYGMRDVVSSSSLERYYEPLELKE